MGVRGPSFESMKTCFSPLHLSFTKNSDFPEVKIFFLVFTYFWVENRAFPEAKTFFFFWFSPNFWVKIDLSRNSPKVKIVCHWSFPELFVALSPSPGLHLASGSPVSGERNFFFYHGFADLLRHIRILSKLRAHFGLIRCIHRQINARGRLAYKLVITGIYA